ncbi:unnamed protein product [Lasius platythorax]|uniref:Uncharacterized protein n=1 Tax=Lasius platythorax TaxID=488582 RepID=A0AAV2P1R6_9HYME
MFTVLHKYISQKSSDKSTSDKQKNENTNDKGSNPARQTRASCAKKTKDIPRECTAEVNESNACLEENVKQSQTERVGQN